MFISFFSFKIVFTVTKETLDNWVKQNWIPSTWF